jgi:hypothetical protein
MKITGLTIWQATHQVLIQQGLLTTGIQADVIASCLFAYFLRFHILNSIYIIEYTKSLDSTALSFYLLLNTQNM